MSIFTESAAPRNCPIALVAVANPLPELLSPEEKEPPKSGGGYVELGVHVVVCSLVVGLDVTIFFVVLTGRGVVKTEGDLLVIIVVG